ncbi:MAG: hypothetical protein M3164_00785 [Actinomycetota bacterium]|nr:hypothetical protein [Actinomycetota bacterium]
MTGPLRGSLPVDPERRTRLLAAKLRALLKRHWPDAGRGEPVGAAGGVAVQQGSWAWILADGDATQGFARALLWALHRRVAELHVLADAGPALVAAARQAVCFRTSITVWAIDGTELATVDPAPLPPEPPLDPDAEPFVSVIEAAGAEAVIEWGILTAEVLGLEVARVHADEDGARLEVGLGEHDRLINRMAWGDLPPAQALARIVEVATAARRSGDLTHPLNSLGRERWLRHRLVHDPSPLGVRSLRPVSPPRPRTDLTTPLLAPASGRGHDGPAVLAACSVAFDPTFVPMAAELHGARTQSGSSEHLLLVLPEGDLHPLIQLAADDLIVVPAIRTVRRDWYAERSR